MNTSEFLPWLKSKKKLPQLLLLLLFMLLFSMLLLNSAIETRDSRSSILSKEGSNEYDDSLFTEEELRLKNMLESIEGVGDVQVMIQSETAEEKTTNGLFAASEPVSAKPAGVIVAAEGGENPLIQSRIINAVSTLCSIEPNAVAVFSLQPN